MTELQKKKFQKLVWDFYNTSGRSLPWRETQNPYKILVSEIMLQQTQALRVIPKYKAFIKVFPNVKSLAGSSLAAVLAAWQGLGYNRRAKFLREAAVAIQTTYSGRFPKNEQELLLLPGIGKYTAGAVCSFAYNQPAVIIETNIRQVFLHYFFKNKSAVSDSAILPLIAHTLDAKKPREWYWALMDYGSYLKKINGNLGPKSKHHVTQSKFVGSLRQVRGFVVKSLIAHGSQTKKNLVTSGTFSGDMVGAALEQLAAEGIISILKNRYHIA